MKRVLVTVLTAAGLTLAAAAPASAHVLVVDNGQGEPKVQMVGGGPLPDSATGKGLVPGGRDGAYLQSPAHAKGLNSACTALRENGNGVVDMWGPPFAWSCNHGGPPMPPPDED